MSAHLADLNISFVPIPDTLDQANQIQQCHPLFAPFLV